MVIKSMRYDKPDGPGLGFLSTRRFATFSEYWNIRNCGEKFFEVLCVRDVRCFLFSYAARMPDNRAKGLLPYCSEKSTLSDDPRGHERLGVILKGDSDGQQYVSKRH